ncbi:MAG: lipopolysaccharide kinase InaA family protein [Desulfobulbaceae bacterium]|nr:lipopolysaccharide kinase InaA family protein [Desulfobulbaceae bacterium]
MLSFESVWHIKSVEIIKEIKDRTVERTFISCGPHQEDNFFFYIKKHCQPLGFLQKFLSFLQVCTLKGEGIREFDNYCKFRQKGLGTAIPVASGMRSTSGCIESFLITRDFSPFIDLEELVLNQHGIFNQNPDKIPVKKKILDTIATYARKMHKAGFNQKDFNATHILLHGLDSEQLHMCLFDLQRVDKNILNRFKWPIKAFAELNYTLPKHLFADEDRLYLFKSYLRKNNLNLYNKLQWFWIKRKTARIARHSRKRGLAPKMTING